jgi:hypothetical protein
MPQKTPGTVFIALSGKKQVGKDLSASMMKKMLESQGYRVAVTAFAKPLKELCIDILNMPHEGVWGNDDEKNQLSHIMWDTLPDSVRYAHALDSEEIVAGPNQCVETPKVMRSGPMTHREVMQIVGTEIFRGMLYWNVWADLPFNRNWDEDFVFITDCRFPNEKETVEHNGGIVLRITRTTGLEGDQHASETSLDHAAFNFHYHNDGTLQELEEFLIKFLQEIVDGTIAETRT